MFIEQFKDFSKYKADGFEGAVFISSLDNSLHIVDFKIESRLQTQDICLIKVGTLKEVITSYNTLKFSTLLLYDIDKNGYIPVKSSKWSEYLYLTANGKLTAYEDNFKIISWNPEWFDLGSLFAKVLPQIENTKVSFNIQPGKLEHQDYLVKQYYTPNSTHYNILLCDNYLKSLIQIYKKFFNYDLKPESLNSILQEKYPSYSIETDLNKIYFKNKELFSNF